MFRQINSSKVSDIKKYKYSGLSFLIYPDLIAQITKKKYTDYLQENFYIPLEATTLGYRPKTKNFKNLIVPTEIDTIFRKELTKNWVHDENAALLGGISGNAGLFGTSLDLAKIMQMYSNYGIYGGKRYIAENTLKEFTKIQYPENENRRGLGFDKPLIDNATLSIEEAYPAPEASPESFGHSGFTGTFVWADPKNDLVFIFLSNRVYPSREHKNIYTLNIRPKLQQVFYKAIKNKK
jgi:CubicO group peptidase (beta-lactamase class C family)